VQDYDDPEDFYYDNYDDFDGYVANSSYTVLGESMSAGRIYDKIGDTAKAKVVLITPHGTICSLSKKSLINNKIMDREEN
jgi:hypothetical protein